MIRYSVPFLPLMILLLLLIPFSFLPSFEFTNFQYSIHFDSFTIFLVYVLELFSSGCSRNYSTYL